MARSLAARVGGSETNGRAFRVSFLQLKAVANPPRLVRRLPQTPGVLLELQQRRVLQREYRQPRHQALRQVQPTARHLVLDPLEAAAHLRQQPGHRQRLAKLRLASHPWSPSVGIAPNDALQSPESLRETIFRHPADPLHKASGVSGNRWSSPRAIDQLTSWPRTDSDRCRHIVRPFGVFPRAHPRARGIGKTWNCPKWAFSAHPCRVRLQILFSSFRQAISCGSTSTDHRTRRADTSASSSAIHPGRKRCIAARDSASTRSCAR